MTAIGMLLMIGVAQAQVPSEAADGQALYEHYCASCHGVGGKGDGPKSLHLDPPPANLRETLKQNITTDDYLLWTLSEGGRPTHSAMPAFQAIERLEDDELRAIIRYIQINFK